MPALYVVPFHKHPPIRKVRCPFTQKGLVKDLGPESHTKLFRTKLLETLSGRGRPRKQSWTITTASKSFFGAALVMGKNLLSPGHRYARIGSAGNLP